MTDGESARCKRSTPTVVRADLMTDGAIRCRQLLTVSRCHSRFPTLRCVPTSWLPRCRFKLALRVVSPSRISRAVNVVGWLTELEQLVKLPFTLSPQSKRKAIPLAASRPRFGVFSFLTITACLLPLPGPPLAAIAEPLESLQP